MKFYVIYYFYLNQKVFYILKINQTNYLLITENYLKIKFFKQKKLVLS